VRERFTKIEIHPMKGEHDHIHCNRKPYVSALRDEHVVEEDVRESRPLFIVIEEEGVARI